MQLIHITVLFMQLWVSHVIVAYTNNTSRMFFCNVINYIQQNSANTVKFNFPWWDIVWFEKPNVNVVK